MKIKIQVSLSLFVITIFKNLIYRNIDDTSDYRAMAAAYLQLGDNDMCIKYYEKYTKKFNKEISDNGKFSKQQQSIVERSYWYEKDDTITLLPRLFHGLNEKIRQPGNFEKSKMLDMADCFFECGVLYKEKSFYLESTNAYVSAFGLYVSKPLSDDSKLTDVINNLLNVFIEGKLKWESIIEVCTSYLPTNITDSMQLRVAAMFREDEIYGVEDLDGDDDTSNESRNIALQHYKDLLKVTSNIIVKGACYFNILNLYKNHIYEDDSGKSIVEDMMNLLPKFTIYDRRLLVKLAIDFMAEYDNNKGTCDRKINSKLQKMEKDFFAEKLEIYEKENIGKYLTDCDDLKGARDYWNLVAEQIENSIPHWILSLIRDPDSTFDDILHTIKLPQNDTALLLELLVSTYDSLGDYYILDAKNSQTIDTNCLQQAETKYKNALHLLKRFNTDSKIISSIEKKLQQTAFQIKQTE